MPCSCPLAIKAGYSVYNSVQQLSGPNLHGQGALGSALVGRRQQERQVRQAGGGQPLEEAPLRVVGLGADRRRRPARFAAAEILYRRST